MLAYVLFRDHGITPGEYSRMPLVERAILTAFVKKMYDEKQGGSGVRLIKEGEE